MLCVCQVFERLKRETGKVEGAWVENNKFCITVHFRRVNEEVSEEGPCVLSPSSLPCSCIYGSLMFLFRFLFISLFIFLFILLLNFLCSLPNSDHLRAQ